MVVLKGLRKKAVMEKLDAVRRIDYIKKQLYKGRRIPMREFADATGVSVRTIYRDIDYLATQMPLDIKHGKGGGVLYVGKFRPDMIMTDDVKALEVILEYEVIDPEIREIIEGLKNKLGRCLPKNNCRI